MTSIYLNICLAEQNQKRILVENIQSDCKTMDLKIRASQSMCFSKENISLVYQGIVLHDDKTIAEQKIKSGSTVHVFKKYEPKKVTPVTDQEITQAIEHYKSIKTKVYVKDLSPEYIQRIIDKYPDFYEDLGSFAILKDVTFLNKMRSSIFLRNIAEHYPTIIRAAKMIVDVRKEAYQKYKNTPSSDQDWMSSPSQSDEGESQSPPPLVPIPTTTTTATTSTSNRVINRGQLETALIFANAMLRSRYDNNGSSSSGTQNTTAVSAISTANEPMNDDVEEETEDNRDGNVRNNDNVYTGQLEATQQQPQQTNSQTDLLQRYATQLQTMAEFGFTNVQMNLEALILSDGNAEAAINLVVLNTSD